jgi:Sulfotransferase domain
MARNHLFTQQVWQAPAVRTVRHMLSAKRAYRYLTAPHRRLPDFIIAGAQKSGTTSLWAYLSEHPEVEPPMTKEMSFFDVNFHRGLNWYRMHFPLDIGARPSDGESAKHLTGESTAYYMFHPLAPARIAQTLPETKIILLLRNPVSRAFSHYQLKLRRRQETLTFEEAIDKEAERLAGEEEKIIADPRYYSEAHDRFSYLARGLYLEQVRRWQQFFPPAQLLILESNEFFHETGQVFDRVLDFLGLARWQPQEFGNRFPGNYTDKMSDATRRRLVEYFAPHNERLYAHLGTRYDWDR